MADQQVTVEVYKGNFPESCRSAGDKAIAVIRNIPDVHQTNITVDAYVEGEASVDQLTFTYDDTQFVGKVEALEGCHLQAFVCAPVCCPVWQDELVWTEAEQPLGTKYATEISDDLYLDQVRFTVPVSDNMGSLFVNVIVDGVNLFPSSRELTTRNTVFSSAEFAPEFPDGLIAGGAYIEVFSGYGGGGPYAVIPQGLRVHFLGRAR